MLCLVLSLLITTLVKSDWSCDWKGPFDVSRDHRMERDELVKFAKDLNVENWNENENWTTKTTSFCYFHGICCTQDENSTNRVSEIHLERNNLSGRFSDSFAMNLPLLRILNVHLNDVKNFPSNIASLTHLNEAKFGRNPICGTIPHEFSSLTQLTKFNCNFCCLTGTMPDSMFENMSNLEETFWDGNSLTGTLPSSLARLESLTKISFNLNSMRGPLPNLCELRNLHDCRLGSDQSFEA